MVPAALKELCRKKVLDFRLLCPSRYQVPCFSYSGILQTYIDCWGWGSNVQGMQDWVPLFPLTSCVSWGPRGFLWGPFCITWEESSFFMLVSSEKGDMLYTGVSYWYCQPQALISAVIFSCLILLIKESLFSITLNQDLFIVQETIKTLMGCDWPGLPLWPYFCTAHTQHLGRVKLFPDPPNQMPSPRWALA